PYALGGDYLVVGYKGANFADAGLFYCPYVPLQMVRAVDPSTFQPKIGFKTRYGMVANPFAEGAQSATGGLGILRQDSNVYYRRVIVTHIG
ncbi:MAG TPA: ATP-binding protein, partial [Methylomirabilota bacterium]|nr:ATP-binding protein [Methylomirabilota bacterium]